MAEQFSSTTGDQLPPCSEWQDMLVALPGELTQDERVGRQAHIEGCLACREVFAEYQALQYVLYDSFLEEREEGEAELPVSLKLPALPALPARVQRDNLPPRS